MSHRRGDPRESALLAIEFLIEFDERKSVLRSRLVSITENLRRDIPKPFVGFLDAINCCAVESNK